MTTSKIIPTEQEDHIVLIEWANHHKILRDYLIHIPNGGYRNKLTGINLKRMGVRKGVSDLFLPYPNQFYHGLWVELKRKNSTQSSITEEQKQWIKKMDFCGYSAQVATGLDHAMRIFTEYLSNIMNAD